VKISNKRLLVQLGFFVIFNAAFLGLPLLPVFLPVFECFAMPDKTVLCNFGILQRNLSFMWTVSPAFPLASLAMFVIVGATLGRALCGWACPLGFSQDVMASGVRLFKKRQKEPPQKLHSILTSVKYMVLFASLVIVASVSITYLISWLSGKRYAFSLGVCGQAPYCVICPVPVLFGTLPSLIGALFSGAPIPQLPFTFYIGLSVLIFLIAASIITRRFWCRYLCPMGALMSLFNKFSLLHIKKKEGKCNASCREHLQNCSKNCPMGIQVSQNLEPSSNPECILCYQCAESCPNKAMKYKLG
jgi:ferredoxin-type protein NapH